MAQIDQNIIDTIYGGSVPQGSIALLQNMGDVPLNASGFDAGRLRLAYLMQYKQDLESGKMSVADYMAKAQPLAQQALKDTASLGSSGSGGADQAKQLLNALDNAGIGYDKADNTKAVINLPEKYQQEARDATGPSNLTPGTKERIGGVPNDIATGTDRYAIEQEGARQADQQAQLAATQKAAHQTSLNEYADLLGKNQQSLFNRAIPTLAEQANTKGMYRSTGFGDSLAREYAGLTADTQFQLGQKASQYGDMDTAALSNATNIAQSYQGQGLQRQLNLEDYNKQVQDAVKYGKEFQPVSGKTNGDRILQTVGAANSTISTLSGAAKNMTGAGGAKA